MNQLKKRGQKRGLDLLEDTNLLQMKKVKYKSDERRNLYVQLQVASKELREAELINDTDIIKFWKMQDTIAANKSS